jgi:hypothetical protein
MHCSRRCDGFVPRRARRRLLLGDDERRRVGARNACTHVTSYKVHTHALQTNPRNTHRLRDHCCACYRSRHAALRTHTRITQRSQTRIPHTNSDITITNRHRRGRGTTRPRARRRADVPAMRVSARDVYARTHAIAYRDHAVACLLPSRTWRVRVVLRDARHDHTHQTCAHVPCVCERNNQIALQPTSRTAYSRLPAVASAPSPPSSSRG